MRRTHFRPYASHKSILCGTGLCSTAAIRFSALAVLAVVCNPLFLSSAKADNAPKTIAQLKPSVVAIATLHKTRVPAMKFIGTGFIVGDGQTIITNAHVVQAVGVTDSGEILGVVTGNGTVTDFREAKLINQDTERDLAQLRHDGPALPPLKIGNSDSAREGQSLLFTGFPLGMVLGFHHVTHRAMISSITPVAIPAASSRNLNAKLVKQLRATPYYVFQLDGTAYPGNSGSPLYDADSGEVFGVINKVFIKETKEAAISQPSGITYAIPSKYILELLERKKND
ncbi:MAG TPA: serine protease [Noviherbaspirillum sp.]|jgi:S1-C subfamily serine protease|uniref:S1 family peptidase n=1 Tax=Noviherbaspirillum sp. TaxID=1926288 RepID=UPI002DDD7A2C|nr:serine protease [Noviherbaspirillum sp.]HEV2612174.1 serine protease [Noviherbaspirillum sp.]